jgi:hypothetical protein
MPLHNSLLDLVGGTPLVPLHRLTHGIAARCWSSTSTSTPVVR